MTNREDELRGQRRGTLPQNPALPGNHICSGCAALVSPAVYHFDHAEQSDQSVKRVFSGYRRTESVKEVFSRIVGEAHTLPFRPTNHRSASISAIFLNAFAPTRTETNADMQVRFLRICLAEHTARRLRQFIKSALEGPQARTATQGGLNYRLPTINSRLPYLIAAQSPKNRTGRTSAWRLPFTCPSEFIHCLDT